MTLAYTLFRPPLSQAISWLGGVLLGMILLSCANGQTSAVFSNAFVNFETAPVHPIDLSPDGQRLAVCNLADGKLEIFDVTSGNLTPIGFVPAGIDPTTVRFRNNAEAWVVNHISGSVSIINVSSLRVMATIETLETPADLVFAGSPQRAFVSCALPNTIQVFDPIDRQLLTNVVITAERPKALGVSPDGRKVYAAIFESGNATTVIAGKFRNLLFIENPASLTNGPYAGQNPPPNKGASFNPPLNPALPTNLPAPGSGIIVKKNSSSRWLDDNQHDWTEFVSGTNAALTQRVSGWDLPDRDLAIIDATDYSVTYATGLMNQCMALGVNPISGRIAVAGTDAINEVRFEPNLNGIFVRVKLALIDPLNFSKAVKDLNPHLEYTVSLLPPGERDKSLGDPRGIVWTADGARGYVAGMGSRNVVVIDSEGNRLRPPIDLGEGPSGLALDEARRRLYVFNRFSSSISVVDTESEKVVNAVRLFDPTPITTAAGRRHLYDTRRTSGLGQASCASCHPDGRMDRLAWDLGNPAGEMLSSRVNDQGLFVTNRYHPMKGVMVTQTLQDIIGHEPFHWRGDRPDIESFNPTFTNLLGAAAALKKEEMAEFRDFLGSIRFPPNRVRNFDNSLSTNVPLPGHLASGENILPAGTPLPNGNAAVGLQVFNSPNSLCAVCHALPSGLGFERIGQAALQSIPLGPNGEHHFPLAPRLEGSLRSKIAQFRNLADKLGMDGRQTESRSGFGFGHDGSVDSLTRFLVGVRIIRDQDTADLIAFLLSAAGSDTKPTSAFAAIDPTPPTALGRQLTLNSTVISPLFDAMLAMARSPTSRVDLIAKGLKDGIARGWLFDRNMDLFQSDRLQETLSPNGLLALAGPGTEITFTMVMRGTGPRLGIDRDLDGMLDRDELDAGTDPSSEQLLPQLLTPALTLAAGTEAIFVATIPPMPAASAIGWWKDGEPLTDETNSNLRFAAIPFEASGNYSVVVSTPFQSYTSAPVHVVVAPLVVKVNPTFLDAPRSSNAFFSATIVGIGPFTYQWQFNGDDLPGQTGPSLMVTNTQLSNEGAYRARVVNSYGAVTSEPVNLRVLISPALVAPPLSQSVVEGGNATFSFTISGHPPPFGYQLRKSSVTLTNWLGAERSAFLTLYNVQQSNAGTYRIVITNAANPSPGLTLDPVTLSVLADTDHDGLPDQWEAANGLATNNADAHLDADLDGQTNGDEYLAGTDPQDRDSFLKVQTIHLSSAEAAAVIQFKAASNKTYTVQYRDIVSMGAWSNVEHIVAFPETNRLVSVTNAVSRSASRYYRLVTPYNP